MNTFSPRETTRSFYEMAISIARANKHKRLAKAIQRIVRGRIKRHNRLRVTRISQM